MYYCSWCSINHLMMTTQMAPSCLVNQSYTDINWLTTLTLTLTDRRSVKSINQTASPHWVVDSLDVNGEAMLASPSLTICAFSSSSICRNISAILRCTTNTTALSTHSTLQQPTRHSIRSIHHINTLFNWPPHNIRVLCILQYLGLVASTVT